MGLLEGGEALGEVFLQAVVALMGVLDAHL